MNLRHLPYVAQLGHPIYGEVSLYLGNIESPPLHQTSFFYCILLSSVLTILGCRYILKALNIQKVSLFLPFILGHQDGFDKLSRICFSLALLKFQKQFFILKILIAFNNSNNIVLQ